MKTLLVVDDHPIVLEGIQSVLSRKGFKVMKASTGTQALAIAGEVDNIDIFVIDLTLVEGADGLTLVERLRTRGITKPIVVYTMHEELWNISAIMKADVQGIVLKGDNIRELVHAIQTVAKGGTYRSGAFDDKRREVMQTNGILSTKDIEVLRRLSNGEGNRDIARAMDISEKSVEYHRSNILRKLCSKTMFEATRRAIALGIIYSLLAIIATPSLSALTASEGPEAIDMGASVIWADRNLNATGPLDGGAYYAFGETEEKDVYDWDTYIHCDGKMWLCHDLGMENLSGSVHDAARTILGDGWRMPTSAEFSELLDLCTARKDTVDGVKCTVLTAPNGQTLTFPWRGYKNGSKILYGDNYSVCYLADFEFLVEDLSSMDIPECKIISPNYIAFTKDGIIVLEGSAPLGMNIRPVRDRENSSVTTLVISPEKEAVTVGIYSPDGRMVGTSTEGLPRGIYIIVRSDGSREKRLIKTL